MSSFSVIISIYKTDRVDWFEQAARSVLDQTCKPTEMLITVDGELPNEHESVLCKLKSEYAAEVNISEVRRKAVNSRGVLLGDAVLRCKTKLIAIMDADDIAMSNRFEKQLKVFSENPGLDVLGGWVEEISPSHDNCSMLRVVPQEHSNILSFSKYRNPINNMTVMFKRDVILQAGNYQGMQNFADYWLWVRALNSGATFGNLPEVLVKARAGDALIRRRSGMGYVFSEARFYMSCYKIGFMSAGSALLAFASRAPFRLLPKGLLYMFFQNYLRK